MKKIVLLSIAILACSAVSRAQGYTLTPQTIVPEGVAADTLKTKSNLAADGTVRTTDNLVGNVRLTNSRNRFGSRAGKWYVGLGGGINLSRRNGPYIDVIPNISYRCNDFLFLGSQFSYSYHQGTSTVGMAPYARLHLIPLGKFATLYVTAYAPCSLRKDYFSLGFSAKPGFGIRVLPGLYFMGSFGHLSYSRVRSGDVITSGWTSDFASDTIDLGFFINL